MIKILVVNPGSTSTKIGYFEGENQKFDETLRHTTEELAPFEKIADQYSFRMGIIEAFLKKKEIDVAELSAVVGMGGLIKPVIGGTYEVNDAMARDLKAGVSGEHASNLGGLISYEIGKKIGVPAYIVDPVVVDEFADISRISGHPLLTRISIFHALNQRAMAHQFCTEQGLQYENTNLVVVHMGGGISVGIHNQGRVIDANNALDGDGPFTPERSGGLPAGELVKLCFSGEHTLPDIKKMLKGKGGMSAYFDTNDMREISERAKKEPKVKLVLDAFVYQIAKEIGAMATAVNGKVDGIILTGGIAYDSHIVEEITKRVSFISRVQAYPGENELMALAGGALRVLTGKEKAKIYE